MVFESLLFLFWWAVGMVAVERALRGRVEVPWR